MSNKNWHDGRRDGRNNHYEPPHEKGVLQEIVSPHKSKELEERRDYKSGYKLGKKER